MWHGIQEEGHRGIGQYKETRSYKITTKKSSSPRAYTRVLSVRISLFHQCYYQQAIMEPLPARLESESLISCNVGWLVSNRTPPVLGILYLGIGHLDAIGWNSTSLNTQISRLPRRPNHPRMPLGLPIGTLASSR